MSETSESTRDAVSTAPVGHSAPITSPEPIPAAFQANPRVAAALSAARDEVARCLMQSVADWDKFRAEVAAVKDLKEYLRRDYHFMVDYLALRFQTGDATYRNLYIGDKIRQAFFEAESSPEAQMARRTRILDEDARGMIDVLRPQLAAADLAAFEAELGEIKRILTTRAERQLEALFLGDCLYLDVTAFLAGACLEDGISINPTLVVSRIPGQLRQVAQAMNGRKFDLIFYSPFTYDNAPEYMQLSWWHQGLLPAARIAAIAGSAVDSAKATLNMLGELFDCPVYVHNSANFRRHDGGLAERIKNLLSWRARNLGRKRVNALMAEYVAQPPATLADRLFLFDEMALVERHGEAALGRLFYNHDSRHPAAMGRWVAEQYRDLVAVQAHLIKKKLVVCDLDETLWEGVIGEGAVRHHLDRQRILKRLQAKGVVLAIASKNDPKNIHWDGGLLNADDFVSAQISWDSKVLSIRRIAQHLNLKSKDFVFIDDRADERAMVNSSLPEVHTLDALAERSWQLLDLWARALTADDGADRTQLYREKEARDGFLQAEASEDPAALFGKLGLTVTLRDARKSDLKRVVELINRTNQFNTCGSRTTLREAGDWLASKEWRILVIDCSDRFGTMGTISICVVHILPDRVEIPVFVLSCRVFGYGIETVILNTVKSMAQSASMPIVGLYQETAHNEPGRKVYPDHDFVRTADGWRWEGAGVPEDPAWLTVQRS